MIDTTSDQDLRSITQKLRPIERLSLIRLLAEFQTCGRIIVRQCKIGQRSEANKTLRKTSKEAIERSF